MQIACACRQLSVTFSDNDPCVSQPDEPRILALASAVKGGAQHLGPAGPPASYASPERRKKKREERQRLRSIYGEAAVIASPETVNSSSNSRGKRSPAGRRAAAATRSPVRFHLQMKPFFNRKRRFFP